MFNDLSSQSTSAIPSGCHHYQRTRSNRIPLFDPSTDNVPVISELTTLLSQQTSLQQLEQSISNYFANLGNLPHTQV